MKPSLLIIGHRGSAGDYPENTMLSFRAALAQGGAQMIEFDVQASKEGTPVIIHDDTLERTTNGRGKIRDYAFAQIKEFDAGYHFTSPQGNSFRGKDCEIPAFEELLREFSPKTLMVEIKDTGTDLLKQTMNLIKTHHAEKQILVGSLEHKAARWLESYDPALTRFFSLRELSHLHFKFRLGLKAGSFKGPRIASMPLRHRWMDFSSERWIAWLHQSGIRVFFWTINDPDVAKQLVTRGADGIITDFPARMAGNKKE